VYFEGVVWSLAWHRPRRATGHPVALPFQGVVVSKRPPRKPMAVGEVLERYLARSGLATRLKQAQVIPAWEALVGPQIAAVTQPESVAPDGTLFVRVATSPWMNELQLMAPEIMARINAGRGPGRIRTIRWRLSS
jgi:predicted nucleic acid-binding Zn ribbon protein